MTTLSWSEATSQMFHYGHEVASWIWLKLGFVLIFAAAAPYLNALVVLLMLCALDFTCGLVNAIRLHAVSSARMRKGVVKLILYFTLILAVLSVEAHILTITDFHLTSGVIGLLAVTELLSILENLMVLGLPVPFSRHLIALLESRGKLVGIDMAGTLNSISLATDIALMLDGPIKRFHNPTLKLMMEIYYASWYRFLQAEPLGDPSDTPVLVWERFRTAANELVRGVRDQFTNEHVTVTYQHQFLDTWVGDCFNAFLIDTKRRLVAADPAIDGTKPVAEAIQAALITTLYRILSQASQWDSQLTSGVPIDRIASGNPCADRPAPSA